ncbi:hypothetical protein Tco_1262278 [Tanacetum coccineum]
MESIKKSINERTQHKREYDSRVNERHMQTTEGKVYTSNALDASLVDTKSSGTALGEQDTSSRSGNDAHVDDADIRPIYNKEPMAEVQLPVENNVFATGQQHTEQHEFNNEGEVDQNAEQCHDKCITQNDMILQSLLEEARKRHKEESGRNLKPSVMPSANSQSTANSSKPKPRIDNQKSRNWPASKTSYVTTKTVPIAEHSRNSRNFSDSKHFVCSTCQKCVFNANHDHCVTKFLNEVNSCAKITTGHKFSTKMTSTVHEKTMTPRSCLRWKPTGRIFKIVGLRWVPTRKMVTSSTTKVDIEPKNGSNEDITNQYECEQTLDVSAADKTVTSQQEFELLFSPMYEEYFNAGNQSVSKSSALSLSLSDNSKHQDTQPTANNQPTT